MSKAQEVGIKRGFGDAKPKDLIGIPWMLAFALRADGWYLRQDIIWHKPNPMPESVTDRCTKAHEYLFLLSKSQKYFFDSDAIKEPAVSTSTTKVPTRGEGYGVHKGVNVGADRDGGFAHDGTRNRRDVWTIATKPYKGAHFATFPTALVEPCVLAGSRPGDIVLDPFMGSGTTAAVAVQHGRKYLGCELNPEYETLQKERIAEWADYLKRDIPLLLGCEAIYSLEGWEDSKGAELECGIAESLGFEVFGPPWGASL
jgi:DNA modification methylase